MFSMLKVAQQFYFRKLTSKELKNPESVFYWKAKEVVPVCDDAPWFTLQMIGHVPGSWY